MIKTVMFEKNSEDQVSREKLCKKLRTMFSFADLCATADHPLANGLLKQLPLNLDQNWGQLLSNNRRASKKCHETKIKMSVWNQRQSWPEAIYQIKYPTAYDDGWGLLQVPRSSGTICKHNWSDITFSDQSSRNRRCLNFVLFKVLTVHFLEKNANFSVRYSPHGEIGRSL